MIRIGYNTIQPCNNQHAAYRFATYTCAQQDTTTPSARLRFLSASPSRNVTSCRKREFPRKLIGRRPTDDQKDRTYSGPHKDVAVPYSNHPPPHRISPDFQPGLTHGVQCMSASILLGYSRRTVVSLQCKLGILTGRDNQHDRQPREQPYILSSSHGGPSLQRILLSRAAAPCCEPSHMPDQDGGLTAALPHHPSLSPIGIGTASSDSI